MRKRSQIIEKKLKQCALVTLLMGGLAVPAFAEPSPLSLPALPALPTVPAAPQPGGIVNPSPVKTTTDSAAPAPAMTAVPSAAPVETPPSTLPSSAAAAVQPEATEAAQSVPTLPPLAGGTLPAIAALPPIALPATPLASAQGPADSAKPSEKKSEKAPPKTWETPLAPVVKPRTTYYHYRRQMLPETIYQQQYSLENRHLPPRITRAEYEGLLFNSIAQGNLEVTRALLNAGTDINAMNAEGETPRRFAERIGAQSAAILLGARGGR